MVREGQSLRIIRKISKRENQIEKRENKNNNNNKKKKTGKEVDRRQAGMAMIQSRGDGKKLKPNRYCAC